MKNTLFTMLKPRACKPATEVQAYKNFYKISLHKPASLQEYLLGLSLVDLLLNLII